MNADPAHILVVDDDARLRDLLQQFLSSAGFRVTSAESAADARARMGSLTFDLIVLDLMMPDETGLEFATALRARQGGELPILMLTAMNEMGTASAASRPARTTISQSPSSRASWCCASIRSCAACRAPKNWRRQMRASATASSISAAKS
jgi:CheY-like chemotaxis protein